jgi:hypothetical protein
MRELPFHSSIHTLADLERAWRLLMEPLGFSGRTLWALMICPDGEVLPQVIEITDMPSVPSPEDRDGLSTFLAGSATHIDPDLRWAFLYSRPGRGGADRRDRAWAQAVLDAARLAGVRCEPVHLATDSALVPIPLDDLAVRSVEGDDRRS